MTIVPPSGHSSDLLLVILTTSPSYSPPEMFLDNSTPPSIPCLDPFRQSQCSMTMPTSYSSPYVACRVFPFFFFFLAFSSIFSSHFFFIKGTFRRNRKIYISIIKTYLRFIELALTLASTRKRTSYLFIIALEEKIILDQLEELPIPMYFTKLQSQ